MNGADTTEKQYAVLMPWVKTDLGYALLLEVRSEHVPQPGEACFPGGRIEAGESASQAAVRETCEELGICPAAVHVISEPGAETMYGSRVVYPVIARIDPESLDSLTISDCEVAEVFLLPASWLAQNPPVHYCLPRMSDDEIPAKLLTFLSRYGDFRHRGETDYLEYDGHGIWGLTAKLLKKHGAIPQNI